MIWDAVVGIVQGIFGTAADVVVGQQKRKTASLENELALAKAKTEATIQLMHDKQSADVAWENLSISNSGWKDEWFTLVLSVPAILCFIPGGAVYVVAGFAALQGCPEWYQWALGIAIGSAFGVKKFTDFMGWKKGV